MGFARPRFNRETGTVYDLDSYAAWKAGAFMVARSATTVRGYPGLVTVAARFVVPRPAKRPVAVNAADWSAGTRLLTSAGNDLDGYLKALLDVLQPTKAQRKAGIVGVIEDDRLACHTTESKWYAAVGEKPFTEVIVRAVHPDLVAALSRPFTGAS